MSEPQFRYHQRHEDACIYDLEPWPCPAAKLLTEVADYLTEAAANSPKERQYGMQCAVELIRPMET